MEFHMKNLVARFIKDESGATAIEYGLIAAGIALAVITAVKSVGTNLTGTFNAVATGVTAP
jgi:pilus assembly protein Flp/PilA